MSDNRRQRQSLTACPIRSCLAFGVPLQDSSGQTVTGTYLLERASHKKPLTASLMLGIPKTAELEQYLGFTHLFAAAPNDYLTPNESFVFLRHHGRISYGKKVLGTYYNERRRRTEDSAYRESTGKAFLPPGHVIRVGKAVSVHKVLKDLDPRYRQGLTPGSIFDPKGGEPFNWQMALVVKTSDLRRIRRSPLSVIRTKDLQVPTASSRAERSLSDSLLRIGVQVCPHIHSMSLSGGHVLPDICIPSLQLVIEYDGSYWHHGKVNQDRDIRKTQKFIEAGWDVIRVREHGLDPLPAKAKGLRQLIAGDRESTVSLADRIVALIT